MKLQRFDVCHDSFDINVSLIKKISAYGNYVKASEHEDAIAERDGKIRALEAMVERLKNCWNCDKAENRCHYFEGPCCERWEEEKL